MFTLPDGTVVDWSYSGHSNGPSCKGGQHVSRNYLWYRVSGGEWQTDDRFRTAHRLLEWLELCDCLADLTGQ